MQLVNQIWLRKNQKLEEASYRRFHVNHQVKGIIYIKLMYLPVLQDSHDNKGAIIHDFS